MQSSKRSCVYLANCFLVLVNVQFAQGSNGLRTVAISGGATPGIEPGVSFDVFSSFTQGPPVLNNRGQVAFKSILSGTDSFQNDTGVWSEGGSHGLRLVAREGSVAPGTNVPFGDFRDARLILSEDGQVAFRAILDATYPGVNSSNFDGFWSEGGGSGLALVARGGDPAPGTNAILGSLHDSFFDAEFAFANSDQLAFVGALTGPGIDASNDRGIWSSDGGGGFELIARSGNAAPGGGAGVNFGLFDRISINSHGETAFRASLTGLGVDNSSRDGIWGEKSSGLTLIAREGDPVPGMEPGTKWGSFDSNGALSFNTHGQTAFRARLSLDSPGVDDSNKGGVWSAGGGNGLELIARGGEQAPGSPPGVNFNFDVFDSTMALNDQGHTAFVAHLQGAETGQGIWSEGGGNGLELVARTGTPVPGVESGVSFDTFVGATVVLNNRGQTAFWANLTGPGVEFANNNDSGIWAQDIAGNLRLIAREGDLLDVSDDPLAPDLRTISVLSWFNGNTGNADGRPSGFNDAGQLAFTARFTDGSEGVFVSNIVAVPEPGTLFLLISLVSSPLAQRWRAR